MGSTRMLICIQSWSITHFKQSAVTLKGAPNGRVGAKQHSQGGNGLGGEGGVWFHLSCRQSVNS